MSANDSGVPGERHKQGKGGPAVVMPSTRVTIAFPFSTIKVTEADDRLKELAAIVAELADQPAALDPTPAAQDVLTPRPLVCERLRIRPRLVGSRVDPTIARLDPLTRPSASGRPGRRARPSQKRPQ